MHEWLDIGGDEGIGFGAEYQIIEFRVEGIENAASAAQDAPPEGRL
jgi:hypothetical protein